MSNNKDFLLKNPVSVGKTTQPRPVSSGAYTGQLEDAGNIQNLFLKSSDTISTSDLDIQFKPDGTKMYTIQPYNRISEYSLSTPWDVSTATLTTTYNTGTSTANDNAYGFYIKPDGTKLYTTDLSDRAFYHYNLSTPWDLTTVSYAGNKSVGGTTYPNWFGDMKYLRFDPTGTTVFFNCTSYNSDGSVFRQHILQGSLSTAWDITTFSVPSYNWMILAPRYANFFFINEGKYILIQSSGSTFTKYELSVPYSFSGTETELGTVAFSSQYGAATDPDEELLFQAAGTTVKTYFLSKAAYELDLSTADVFDVSLDKPSIIKTANAEDTQVASLEISTSGDFSVSFEDKIKFSNNSAPTLNDLKTKVSILTKDAGSSFIGVKS